MILKKSWRWEEEVCILSRVTMEWFNLIKNGCNPSQKDNVRKNK